eukprot:6211846-Pleurochrysis_carterae.AAC.1
MKSAAERRGRRQVVIAHIWIWKMMMSAALMSHQHSLMTIIVHSELELTVLATYNGIDIGYTKEHGLWDLHLQIRTRCVVLPSALEWRSHILWQKAARRLTAARPGAHPNTDIIHTQVERAAAQGYGPPPGVERLQFSVNESAAIMVIPSNHEWVLAYHQSIASACALNLRREVLG